MLHTVCCAIYTKTKQAFPVYSASVRLGQYLKLNGDTHHQIVIRVVVDDNPMRRWGLEPHNPLAPRKVLYR